MKIRVFLLAVIITIALLMLYHSLYPAQPVDLPTVALAAFISVVLALSVSAVWVLLTRTRGGNNTSQPKPPTPLLLFMLILAGCANGSQSSSSTSGAAPHKIFGTVYGFFADERSVAPGYGRYTYLLLARNETERNIAFVSRMFGSIAAASHSHVSPELLNLLSLPVTPRFLAAYDDGSVNFFDPARLRAFVIHDYDYDNAQDLWIEICAGIKNAPSLCSGALTQGPYLVTFARKITPGSVPSPILIADCSPFASRAFPTIINAVLAQMKDPNLDESSRLKTTRLHLLGMVINVSDWLPHVIESVSKYVKIFTEGK